MPKKHYRLFVAVLCLFSCCESAWDERKWAAKLLPETRWVLTEDCIPCFFPFEYDGKLYHQCHEENWCCLDDGCNRKSPCVDGEVDLPLLLAHDRPQKDCTLRTLGHTEEKGEYRWTTTSHSSCEQRRPTVFIFEDGDVMWRRSHLFERMDALMQLARNLKDDGSVLDSFFKDHRHRCSPIQFVFLSYASAEGAAEARMRDMRQLLYDKFENDTDFDDRRHAFQFVSESAWHIQESKCWLSSVVHSYAQIRNFVTIFWKEKGTTEEFDAKAVEALMRASTCGVRGKWASDSAGKSFPSAPLLKWFGAGCGDAILKSRYGIASNDSWPEPDANVEGAVAVVVEGNCSGWSKAYAAQKAGAVALIIVSTSDTCLDVGCALPDACSHIELLIVSIAGREAKAVLEAVFQGSGDKQLVGHFSRKRHGPLFIGMHGSGGGLHLFGALRSAHGVALEARGMLREAGVLADRKRLETTIAEEASLKEEKKSVEIYEVFKDEYVRDARLLANWSVENSKRVRSRQYTSLQVELWMDCRCHNDVICDPWDREIYVFLCPKTDRYCMNGYAKIGQWITTYGREGRWLHDTTVTLPLLMEASYSDSEYVFHFAGLASSTGRANISLFLWFQRKNPTARLHHGVPVGDLKTSRVIGWGHGSALPFDSRWNTEKMPLMRPGPRHFFLPEETTRVILSVLITGHGWGVNKEDCAEFCNHTHHFSVDGSKEIVKAHPLAGSDDGCLKQIDDGVIPNQRGSWQAGRAGWCPGMQVNWWEVDVTNLLLDGKGIQHNITYKALFNGSVYKAELLPEAERDPDGRMCEIIMSSFITFFKEPTLLEPPFISVSYFLGGTVMLAGCLICGVVSAYVRQSAARRTALLAHQDGLEASSAGMLELSCMDYPKRSISGLDFNQSAANDPHLSKS